MYGLPALLSPLHSCPAPTPQDSFHPTVTVLEAVLFQAHMRLGRGVPLATKLQRVREVVGLAGLQGKEDERVGGRLPGGIMIRGLSGGERRRLSLCCGIVAAPEVLFCDEPTSGGSGGRSALSVCARGVCVHYTVCTCPCPLCFGAWDVPLICHVPRPCTYFCRPGQPGGAKDSPGALQLRHR